MPTDEKRSFLAELAEKGLATSATPWSQAQLFQPHPNEQALIYEFADCLAVLFSLLLVMVRCFLKMAGLPFSLVNRANVEHMSPSGEVPLVKESQFIVAGFDTIVEYAAHKGKNLSSFLPEEELADLKATLSLVKTRIRNAEEYICWCHEPTLKGVTLPRYGSYQAWPLSWALGWNKRREVLARLSEAGLGSATLSEVVEGLVEAWGVLSHRLGDRAFLCSSDKPTEVDAYVFGHLYALLTTELPGLDLSAPLRTEFPNLVAYSQRLEKRYFSRNS